MTDHDTGQVDAVYGEHVGVRISDAMDDCIVVTFTDGERASVELTWAEARELIAGLAGVL